MGEFIVINYVKIGDELFHKYLGYIKVTKINDEGIKADTERRGLLDFKYYDFGKVIFFNEEHAVNSFDLYSEYLVFHQNDLQLKLEKQIELEKENEIKRLKMIEKQIEKIRKEVLLKEKEEQLRMQRQKEKELEAKENNIKNELCDNNKDVDNPIISEKQTISTSLNKNLIERQLSKRKILLKIKSEEEIKIREILEQRKINYLFHFTRLDNLSSILQHGLVPISMQYENNLISTHNDENRIDSLFDCTSCSVGFPNYKLFYKFRECKYPGSKWVVIMISSDIIFSPENIVYFCNTNAAGILPKNKTINELCRAISFEKMFCESVINKGNSIVNRNILNICDNFTTDPQAEILISDIIDSSYIKCICFYNQKDLLHYVNNYGDMLLKNFDHKVDGHFFNARNDYMFWK